MHRSVVIEHVDQNGSFCRRFVTLMSRFYVSQFCGISA